MSKQQQVELERVIAEREHWRTYALGLLQDRDVLSTRAGELRGELDSALSEIERLEAERDRWRTIARVHQDAVEQTKQRMRRV